jgi:hypothetical protein
LDNSFVGWPIGSHGIKCCIPLGFCVEAHHVWERNPVRTGIGVLVPQYLYDVLRQLDSHAIGSQQHGVHLHVVPAHLFLLKALLIALQLRLSQHNLLLGDLVLTLCLRYLSLCRFNCL